jgi:hypothetical protein
MKHFCGIMLAVALLTAGIAAPVADAAPPAGVQTARSPASLS